MCNWDLCDEFLKGQKRKARTVDGSKEPDCKAVQLKDRIIKIKHCCTLNGCTEDVSTRQTRVREWQCLAKWPAGQRRKLYEIIDCPYGLQLEKAREDGFRVGDRHLRLCLTVIRPGSNDSMGIINKSRIRILREPPLKDITPEVHAKWIFTEFSLDLQGSFQETTVGRDWNYVNESGNIQVPGLKSEQTGIADVLARMFFLGQPALTGPSAKYAV
jgi:hypothetical protein